MAQRNPETYAQQVKRQYDALIALQLLDIATRDPVDCEEQLELQVGAREAFTESASEPENGVEVALGQIALCVQELRAANSNLDAAVLQARALGVPWDDIGAAVGIRGTSALRRWDAEARASSGSIDRTCGHALT